MPQQKTYTFTRFGLTLTEFTCNAEEEAWKRLEAHMTHCGKMAGQVDPFDRTRYAVKKG